MSQNLKTQAIILRRTNYGEADRILQILTPDNGQISVMARGVRKEKSRLAAGIELFAVCELNLVKSSKTPGDFWTLTGSKMNTFFIQIMENYDRLEFGYEAIKRVDKISRQIIDKEFFELLKQTFALLNDAKNNLKIVKTWFYLRIAKIGGAELNLLSDENGMKLIEDARYDFDLHEQVFVFQTSGRYDAETIKLLRVLTANAPEIIARLKVPEKTIDDALWLAQAAAKI